MARLVGSVGATVYPDRRLILVLGEGFGDFGDPAFTEGRTCYGFPDLLYLVSASSRPHRASVTLQACDAEPPATDAWRDSDTTEFTLRTGALYVSNMLADARLSEPLPVGPSGRYRVRVDVTGRSELRQLEHVPDRPDVVVGVERFRVRFLQLPWSAAGSFG